MSYRVTQAMVIKVIDFDPCIKDITPFIASAEELVTEICATATVPTTSDPGACNTSTQPAYSQARLILIETWLTAHFVAVRDPRYLSETIGAASATRQGGQMGMNLSLTPYGQQVLLLDSQGGLARLDKHVSQGKRAQAGIVHLGDRRKLEEFRWGYVRLLYGGGY